MKYFKIIQSAATVMKGKAKILFLFLALVLLQFQTSSLAAQDRQATLSKSSTTATAIALTGTTLPILVAFAGGEGGGGIISIGSGLVFGPVLGYAYMGYPGIGLRYAGKRLLLLGATAGSILLICSTGNCDLGLFGEESGSMFGVAVFIGALGLTATLVNNIKDSFHIGERVDTHLERISLGPTYFPETETIGIRAKWRF